MKNPIALLGLLVACAVVAGALLWGFSQRALYERKARAGRAPAPEDPAGSEAALINELKEDLTQMAVRNRELEQANADLERRLAELEAAEEFTPEAIASGVAAIRGLAFQRETTFRETAVRAVENLIGEGLLDLYGEGDLEKMERALTTMGFLFDDQAVGIREALVGLETNQRVAVYNEEDAEILYRDDLDLRSPTDRGKLVHEIARVLAEQNFGVPPRELVSTDGDRAQAAIALEVGDATQVKLRYSLGDDVGGAPPPSPESQERFYGAPVFLREQVLFPYFHGAKFVAALQQSGGWEAVDAAYRRPPTSSTEVLHPDLYLAAPPFAPETPRFEDGPDVVWEDTAGEFAISALLGMHLDPSVAKDASEGWAGDRYRVLEGDGTVPGTEPSAWKTRWRTPEDATEFFQAIRQSLLRRYRINFEDETAPPPHFSQDDPARSLRVRVSDDGLGVLVVSAPDAAVADGLASTAAGNRQ
ncbi:hypothetical protein BH23VER1_BH23VER1_26330 [soil metagenome]